MEAPASAHTDGDGGFAAFFRRYARTWQHAVATASLTAFGTLTFVHRLFAVVAILAYLVPPVVLYVRWSRSGDPTASATDGREETAPRGADGRGERSDAGARTEAETDVATDTDADADAETETAPDAEDGTTRDPTPTDPAWTTASLPTGESLLDAAVDGERAYAVGEAGGVFAAGSDRDWECLVADGPGADSNALRGVDAVAGGGVWFTGDGGALGRVDPGSGRHVDHSAPDGDTSNVVDVAATGSPDGETVLLVDGSGRVRRGEYREGEVAWADPVTPGSGSSLAGVTLSGEEGYTCDTSQGVYRTADGGRSFERLGLDGADGTLADVASADGECLVCADDGVVHRYDGTTWTPDRLDEAALSALALEEGMGLASAAGGVVYERSPTDGWEQLPTPATGALRGVALGSERAVAVGADGTVVERAVDPRGE